MICDPCKSAGEALQDGNVALATQKHNICKLAQAAQGNTSRCDCQHRVAPHMINQERVQTDDTAATNQ